MSDDDWWKSSCDYPGDPDNLEIIFDPSVEKEAYIESAARHNVWDLGYLRLAGFVADALALVAPSGVATIRTRTGAGCICVLLHARRHTFSVYFESLSNKGQRIYVEAETLHDKLHGLIPVYGGLEGPRGWSKTLRQVAKFEGIGGYVDSFVIEEEQWEIERQEREEEERRRREQQDEDDAS